MNNFNKLEKIIRNNDYQERLDSLDGSVGNDFYSDEWIFIINKYEETTKIRFDDIEQLFGDGITLNGIEFDNLKDLTKKIWLLMATSKNKSRHKDMIRGLKLLWYAIMTLNIDSISRKNISSIIEIFLTHKIVNGSIIKRLRIYSYDKFIGSINIDYWRAVFDLLGIELISYDLGQDYLSRVLRKSIPLISENELTYTDWLNGGDFDKLGLNNGKYYVEHCITTFETYFPMAKALYLTERESEYFERECGISSIYFFLPIVLNGTPLDEYKSRHPRNNPTKYIEYRSVILNRYAMHYREAKFQSNLFNDDVIKTALSNLNMILGQEDIDRLKSVNSEWIFGDSHISELLQGFSKEIEFDKYLELLDVIKSISNKDKIPEITRENYQRIGLFTSSRVRGSSFYAKLYEMVFKAGAAIVVFLTGWRKSEYGFSYNSIRKIRNLDFLDQYAYPYRYQVDWYIPKTHGNVRVLREISFNVYLYITLLSKTFSKGGSSPAIYPITDKNNRPEDSRGIIARSVPILWKHYVFQFPVFVDFDNHKKWTEINEISKNRPLSDSENYELSRLLGIRTKDEWEEVNVNHPIYSHYLTVREEWPIVEFSYIRKRLEDYDWLSQYRRGVLRSDWREILDKSLDEDAKDWINELDEDQLRNSELVKEIFSKIRKNVTYPNPHSARHMFAQAIQQSFSGDFSWQVRSQFKHLSPRMYNAYVGDKDNSAIIQASKPYIISNTINSFIAEKGKNYTGRFSKYLSRLLRATSILTFEEQKDFIDKFIEREIVDIKVGLGGACILRKRTQGLAKCSSLGEPQRHSATPFDCLGCTHNLMTKENLDWMLLKVSPHVEALRSDSVPMVFKESSHRIVRDTHRNLNSLDSQHPALEELGEVLKHYEKVS